MSQHQAGFAGLLVKRLKQTALTWKVKDKETTDQPCSWQEEVQDFQSVA